MGKKRAYRRDGKKRKSLTILVTTKSIKAATKKAKAMEPSTNLSGWFEKQAEQ